MCVFKQFLCLVDECIDYLCKCIGRPKLTKSMRCVCACVHLHVCKHAAVCLQKSKFQCVSLQESEKKFKCARFCVCVCTCARVCASVRVHGMLPGAGKWEFWALSPPPVSTGLSFAFVQSHLGYLGQSCTIHFTALTRLHQWYTDALHTP